MRLIHSRYGGSQRSNPASTCLAGGLAVFLVPLAAPSQWVEKWVDPGWAQRGPAVYRAVPTPRPGPGTNLPPITNLVFSHFLPETLSHRVYTNVLARTNGREMRIWDVREHPTNWPAKPPVVRWNPKGLMWGMKGLTAISPCWELEGSSGQVPITALTRRHGFTRGHGMGDDGFRTRYAGKKVWFTTRDNRVIEAVIKREVVRSYDGGARRDYTIVLFARDLPESIEPMRVATTNLVSQYPIIPGAPWPWFKTEQWGNVSADIPGFTFNTWKGGDSGSPDMLPLGNELVFVRGRSTSAASPEMQADLDELCRLEGLNPAKYRLQWVDASSP